jgi:hypothetical protein
MIIIESPVILLHVSRMSKNSVSAVIVRKDRRGHREKEQGGKYPWSGDKLSM